MKVAYLFGSLNRGGAETLLLDVFCNWQKVPFPFIGIHRMGGDYKAEFYAAGPKMFQLKPQRFRVLSYIYKLRKILLTEQVTIVHTQMSLDCIYAKLATIGMGINVVTTFHGFDIGAGKLKRYQNRMAIRLADRVCFVSRYEMEYFAKRYPVGEKGQVVYNGVNFDKIDSAKHIAEFSNTASIKLAMVGNFVKGRSQSIIVKSVDVLKRRGITDFDFYFIGKRVEHRLWRYDDCVQYCMTNSLDNVHFLGGRSDVPSLLKAMDGFVYSTEHDTFGIAVVEAMAAGLPVIVNDWAVMKEITHNGKWATLFRTEDVEDCANKMAELIENLQHNRENVMTQTAQIAQEVRATFSIENHIQQITEIYKEITNNKN